MEADFIAFIDFLPNEILEYIFSFLEDKISLFSVSQVCWKWYLICLRLIDPSSNNSFALRYSCERGYLSVVKKLLKDSRVNPNRIGRLESPLDIACRCGFLDIVKVLIADGRVNPSEKDNYNLAVAKFMGHFDIENFLLQDSRVQESLLKNPIQPLFELPKGDLKQIGWVGICDRENAETILSKVEGEAFLLRWSANIKYFVVSAKAVTRYYHFKLNNNLELSVESILTFFQSKVAALKRDFFPIPINQSLSLKFGISVISVHYDQEK